LLDAYADADESSDASGELTVWDWRQHPGVSSLDTDRLSPRKHTGKTIFTISIGYRKLVMTLRSYVKYLLRLARVQHPKNRSSWEALPLGKKTDIGFEDLLCQASKWIVLW